MKVILSVFLCLISQIAIAGEIHRGKHDDFIALITPKINSNLIHHGLCKNINDCTKKRILFFSPGGETLYVNLYSVASFGVAKDILYSILNAYEEEALTNSVKIDIYRESHSYNSGFLKTIFDKKKTLITASIKEN